MLFCKGVCSAVDAEAAGLTATGGLSGAVCASPVPAKRPSRPHANIAVTAINVFTEDLFLLWNELLRDRKRPPKPKCPRCNLQPRRSLLTFVLVAIVTELVAVSVGANFSRVHTSSNIVSTSSNTNGITAQVATLPVEVSWEPDLWGRV